MYVIKTGWTCVWKRVDCSKLYLLSCKHITNTTLSKRAWLFLGKKWISMPNIVPYHFICKYLHFPQDRKLNPEIEKAINQVPFLGSEIIHEQKKTCFSIIFFCLISRNFSEHVQQIVFSTKLDQSESLWPYIVG